ncbi:MAG TPA: flippase-like domain-containing protein [Candidatus Aquicultor sp.]|jgi:hypothetical protein
MSERVDLERAKKGILIVVLIGIATMAVIIALTFKPGTLRALTRINSAYLWLAVGVAVISWIFSSFPFYILTRVVKKPISFFNSAIVFLGGSFFGNITPFGSGLLPAQIYILTHEGLSIGQATAVVSTRATISSWLFAVLGFTIFITFRSSLSSSVQASLLGIALAAAVWSLLTLFFIKQPVSAKNAVSRITGARFLVARVNAQRLESIRTRVYREIDYLSSNLKDLFAVRNTPAILAVFVSEIVAWFSMFAILPLVLIGFNAASNLGKLAFRILLIFSVAPVSPTPGGSGVVEAAFTGLLLGLVPGEIIGLIVLVWRAITYYLLTFVGGIVMVRFIAKVAFVANTSAKNT